MIEKIQMAIDKGEITVHAARAFAGLNEKGQKEIWNQHANAIKKMSGGRLHTWVRATYPPTNYAYMYKSPETIINQLNRPNSPRKAKKRTNVSVDEKKALLKDIDAKRIELEDKQLQIKEYENHINATIPVIEAIMDNNEVWNSLPASIRSDFEEFADRYLV